MMGKKLKKIKALQVLMAVTVGMLAGCSATNQGTAASSTVAEVATSTVDYDLTFSSDDLEIGYDEADATTIQLADDQSSTDGEGVSVDGNIVTITSGGTYLISGTLSDGQIKITAPDTEDVHLILNGVSITSSSSAPLLIEEADTVYVTLAADTENTLTDKAGSTATIGTGTDATKIDGTIFSKTDLTINGSGSLIINGNTNHGIVSKDDLTIVSGTYQITAAGQGLSGKDSVKIKDGTFTLKTGKDGIQSDNADEEGKGFVYISGGTFTIDSQGDAIQAETLLQADDGEFDILTGGGSENAPAKTAESGGFEGPMGKGGPNDSDTETLDKDTAATTEKDEDATTEDEAALSEDADTTTETTSTKGLKSGTELIVNGGTFTIDSADDSIHSDGNVTLAAGSITATTGDDGVHADGDLMLSGADFIVTKSYEGIEGKTITISAGNIDVTASDDGLNAAGGDEEETTSSDQSKQDPFSSNSANKIVISGGTIAVDAGGDGLDSNGTLEITGGNTIVSGPEDDGNGTIDSEGEAVITGGTLMGAGSSGMPVSFADTSSQASVLYGFETTYEAGSTIKISDENDNELLSWTAAKSFTSVQFSSADLTEGETYSITVNEEIFDVTLEGIATSSGISTGQMGGGMQPNGAGGEMKRPDFDDMEKPSSDDMLQPDSAENDESE